ncbi:hypothetical protein CIB48_g8164 [Xylaria polymorpha]|nr:hypothetical protein CIB48_g8164 [Xylaria polymorpha]
MFQSIFIALIAVIITLPQILAGNLVVNNRCEFEIWCGSAANDGTFTPAAKVYMGQVYVSPQPAVPGEKGVVVKCGRRSDLREPYQLEVAQDADTRTWFDLSNLDGRPFERYKRHAEIVGVSDFFSTSAEDRSEIEYDGLTFDYSKTNCVLDCAAGEIGCEWPHELNCYSTKDVVLTLC